MQPSITTLRWWHLSRLKGFGSAAASQLCALCEPFNESKLNIDELIAFGVESMFAKRIAKLIESDPSTLYAQLPDSLRHWLDHPEHMLVARGEPGYPQLLSETIGGPICLYIKSKRGINENVALAIVGSRKASIYGEQYAHYFARSLAEQSVSVISGLARGIDAAAHRGALKGSGHTVAVMGTGIECIYPYAHKSLAQSIVDQGGALVSEFDLHEPARPHHFPRRNRIIAGLSMGCLVVEAEKRSGSLITARLSADYGRDVFALPGQAASELSKGCHDLIRQGGTLVDSPEQILEQLGLGREVPNSTDPKQSDSDSAILKALSVASMTYDDLLNHLGISNDLLIRALMELEARGHIQLKNGWYVRCP